MTAKKKQEAKPVSDKLQEILIGGCKFIFQDDPLNRTYEVDKFYVGMMIQQVYRVVIVGLKEARVPEGSIDRVNSHGDNLCIKNTIVGKSTDVTIDVKEIAIL